MTKTRVVDFTDDMMEYGRTIHEDGTTIPFCRLHTHKNSYTVFWDYLAKKWVQVILKPEFVMAEHRVFDRFVDDATAPHGYKTTYRTILSPFHKSRCVQDTLSGKWRLSNEHVPKSIQFTKQNTVIVEGVEGEWSLETYNEALKTRAEGRPLSPEDKKILQITSC